MSGETKVGYTIGIFDMLYPPAILMKHRNSKVGAQIADIRDIFTQIKIIKSEMANSAVPPSAVEAFNLFVLDWIEFAKFYSQEEEIENLPDDKLLEFKMKISDWRNTLINMGLKTYSSDPYRAIVPPVGPTGFGKSVLILGGIVGAIFLGLVFWPGKRSHHAE